MTQPKRNQSRHITFIAGAFCLLLLAPCRSYAAPVTFSFAGSVSDVNGGVFTSGGSGANGFATSLPLTGQFTFNSATPDVLSSDPSWGLYVNPIQTMTLKIGTYTASFLPGSSVVQVIKNPGLGDIYRLTVNGLSGSTVNSQLPTMFDLELSNPNGNSFANDSLPTAPPSLSSFASNQWRLIFNGTGSRIQGALTSLVPLPAAVWLFGAGLVALVGLGSRGLTSKKDSRA